MQKTKFDVYFEIYQKVADEFSDTGSKKLSSIIESFSKSIEQINSWVTENKLPAPKSEIAKGLEQGLNELPLLFEDIEPELQEKVFGKFYDVVNSVIPDYFEKIDAKIQGIIKRGKIKSDSEFYLIRNWLDQIEGSGTKEESTVSGLLDKYEATT